MTPWPLASDLPPPTKHNPRAELTPSAQHTVAEDGTGGVWVHGLVGCWAVWWSDAGFWRVIRRLCQPCWLGILEVIDLSAS